MCLALALRLLYCFVIGPSLVKQHGEQLGWTKRGVVELDPYDRIARNLIAGNGYVDNGGRRNYERTPGYVLFLAGLYSLFGAGPSVVPIAQSLLDTLSCLLIFLLARQHCAAPAPAILAALLYAVFYKMINIVSRPMSETLYVALMLAFLLLFVASFSNVRWGLMAGLALGLLTITRPVTLLFPLVAIALYLVHLRRRALLAAIPFALAFLLAIAPVFAVNYRSTGRLFFSLGSGRALYMGTMVDYARDLRTEEDRLLAEIGRDHGSFPYDPDVDAQLAAVARSRIAEAPGEYAARVLYRCYVFWTFPDYSNRLVAIKTAIGLVFTAALLLLAGRGVVLAQRQGALQSPVLALFFYCYASYCIVYAHARYSLPLYPILFVLASLAIAGWWKGRVTHRRRIASISASSSDASGGPPSAARLSSS